MNQLWTELVSSYEGPQLAPFYSARARGRETLGPLGFALVKRLFGILKPGFEVAFPVRTTFRVLPGELPLALFSRAGREEADRTGLCDPPFCRQDGDSRSCFRDGSPGPREALAPAMRQKSLERNTGRSRRATAEARRWKWKTTAVLCRGW